MFSYSIRILRDRIRFINDWLSMVSREHYSKEEKIQIKELEQAIQILEKAEPVITEDRIVEVLHNYRYDLIHYSSYETTIDEDLFPDIAKEILKGQGWEVVKGVLGYSCYSYFLNQPVEEDIVLDNILNKFKDKNIEIAVREVIK
jgi:hypothetical protein